MAAKRDELVVKCTRAPFGLWEGEGTSDSSDKDELIPCFKLQETK